MTTDHKLQVSAATVEAWEQRYQTTIGSAPTDDDELALIRDLRAKVQGGLVWNESGEEVYIGRNADWTPTDVRAAVNEMGETDRNKRRLLMFVGGVLGLFLCLAGIVMSRNIVASAGKGRGGSTPTLIAMSQLGAGGGATPQATFVPVAVNTDRSLRLPLDAPRSIEVRGQPFPVVAGTVKENGSIALVEIDEADPFAVWFPSPANWLMGLPESMVQSIQMDDRITARTITGQVLTFVVDQITEAQPQEIELLAQRRAGMTLMPFPSSGAPVRLVSARYDPLDEKPAMTTTDGQIGTWVPSATNNEQFVITGVAIERQFALGVYAVMVVGETGAALPPPMLEVDGQVYPSTEVGLPSGSFTVTFITTSLGRANLLLDGRRIDLGELQPPRLTAQIITATLNNTTLDLTLVVTAEGGVGDVAYVHPEDMALVVSAATNREGSEVGPQTLEPVQARVAPGQPATVSVRFVVPPGTTLAQVRLFDELWAVGTRP